MSSVLRPRGPENPSVYWRRRAVVIGVVVVLLAALGWLIFGRSSGQPQASPTPSPSPSASGTAAAEDQESSDSQASEKPDPSASSSARADETPACSDDDIEVTAATDKKVYAAGENPQITLTIENTSDADCLRDIGSGANEIVVTSGGQHAWSSDDCDPSAASNEQILAAGARAQVTVTWERKLSAPGCAGDAPAAQAGAYAAEARNGDVVSQSVRFELQ